VAKGKKTGGRDFLPGQSGNPGGREPMTEGERLVRKLTKAQFKEVAEIIAMGATRPFK
jgi:hypothetical protein